MIRISLEAVLRISAEMNQHEASRGGALYAIDQYKATNRDR